MTRSCASAIAAALLFFQAGGRAVEPDRLATTAIPPVPFSAEIPDGLEWEVAISPREKSEKTSEKVPVPPAPEIDEAAAKRLSIYRERLEARTVRGFRACYAAGIRKEILTFGRNVKLERYLKSGRIFYTDAASGRLVIDFREPSASGPVWGVGTFRELSWVCADRYAGVQSFRGKKCHVYRGQARPASPVILEPDRKGPPSEKAEDIPWGQGEGTTAFIDIETLLPVAMEMPGETWIYKIIALHSTVRLPDLYAQKLEQLEKRGEKLRNKYRVNQ